MPIALSKCFTQGIIRISLDVDKLPKPHRKPAALPNTTKVFFFLSFCDVCEPTNLKRNVGLRRLSSSSARRPLFISNLKKGNQARPDSLAACHPLKDDVTEWKQGHDLNMSERVEEEFNSIYRSNIVIRPFSLMLTSGKVESATFSD